MSNRIGPRVPSNGDRAADDPVREAYEAGEHERAYEAALVMANHGQLDAQVFVAWMLWQGVGTPKDLEAAIRWLTVAHSKGDPSAGFYLGKIRQSQGDAGAAFKNYETSASANFLPAIYRLGLCFERGYGVAADLNRALELYERGVARNHVFSMKRMGVLLVRGHGGLLRRICIAPLFIKAALIIVTLGAKDPYSEQLIE